MNKLNFTSTSSIRSDETQSFKVDFPEGITVKDFVNIILTERDKEWGYIGIQCDSDDFSKRVFGYPQCEYRWGKLVTKPLPDDTLARKITSIKSDGGWSRMDYLLKL